MSYLLQICLSVFLTSPAHSEQSIQIPLMTVSPKIDGNITLEEWGQAAGFCGLQSGGNLGAREGLVYVGCDAENFYAAFRTELPPNRKLVTNIKRRGGQVVKDDSIELWIVPPKEGRADGPRSQGYFQLIANSEGVVYDRHHAPGYGLAPQVWNAKLVMKNRLTDDGYWECELAIPLSEFGIQTLNLPSQWRVLPVRNFKNPWAQANLTGSGSFTDVDAMMPMKIRRESPAVQVLSTGDLRGGIADIAIAVNNPSDAPIDVVIECSVRLGQTSVVDRKETVNIPAQTSHTLKLERKSFTPAERNLFSLTVNSPDGEKIFYRRHFGFTPAPTHKWSTPSAFLNFALSFDNESLEPEVSKGKGEPVKTVAGFEYVDGIKGKGLLLPGKSSITFDREKHLTIPGAISFWLQIKRDRIRHPNNQRNLHTIFFMTQFKGSGYIGLQDTPHNQFNLWLHHFPEMRNWNVSSPFPWQKERWYHMCANLDGDSLELFLDGERVAQATLERKLKQEELLPFSFGGYGPYVVDEIQTYGRTLSTSEVRQLAMGEETMDGRIAYFPSLKSLVIDAVADPNEQALGELALVVTDGNEAGELLRTNIADEDWKRTPAGTLLLRRIVKLPVLPDGTYKTWLESKSEASRFARRTLSRSFKVKRFEWENSALGKSNLILPPFTPLEVQGNTVKAILREHTMGPAGLWSQVKSLEQDILARPIALHAIGNGKELKWDHGPAKVIESVGHKVRLEAASATEMFSLSSQATYDYDGLMMVKFNFQPKEDAVLDALWMEIPIKKSIASLFHASGEHIRANPAGAVPEGNGVVWNSRSIPQSTSENFIPYIWVGGPERGICWVADWDKDWVHSDTVSAVQLVREDSAVVIRINLINGPIGLTRPREIEFGLQASPVKPMPENWQFRNTDFVWPGTGRYALLWAASWGAHYGWSSRYPLDEDYSLIHKITETKKAGEIDNDFIKTWVDKVMNHPSKIGNRISRKTVDTHVRFAFQCAKSQTTRQAESKMLWYSCARNSTGGLPEFDVYGDEWDYQAACDSSPSFVDYAVHYANKMMDAGMEGIYIDNTFTAAKYSWPMGDAYIDENHEIRPNMGVISRTRNLVKRLAVMMAEKDREPFVWVHMTNGNLLPMLSFAQATLGWEWKYSAQDYQDKFTPEYMRTMNTGRQSGTLSVLLGGTVVKDPDENIRVSRTGLAMALPHQTFFYSRMHGPTCIKARDIIRSFLSEGDCEEWPYWDAQSPVRASAPLIVTAYSKANEVLLVIGNMGDKGTYPITLDKKLIELKSIAEVTDAETEKSINATGTTLIISVARHDFALIRVELK